MTKAAKKSGPVIHECEQGSDEWLALRLGIPTASMFATVLRTSRDGDKTRSTYMRKLAGERLTGELAERYTNAHMERGNEMEADAREMYAFATGHNLQRIGFISNHGAGCSPDSLIGMTGAAEFKTTLPHLLIEHLLKDEFPNVHMAQCQGILWIGDLDFIDLAIYWPKLPLFCKRKGRDETYIKMLARAVADFNEELAAMVDKIQRIGAPGPKQKRRRK